MATATYNRAVTLPRVYESLRRQTFREFEWLVIDDGSTDQTAQLVARWQQVADFPIRYIRQSNGGLHVATRTAVDEARGELFILLDSDDECTPDALARFWAHWQSIPEAEREQFCGVTALCRDERGRLVGELFPQDIWDSNSLEKSYRYKIKGEKWGFQRIDIMRRYRYPELDTNDYLPSSILWHEIARTYRTRYVNEILRIYYVGEDGRSDNVTLRRGYERSKGEYLWCRFLLSRDMAWLRYDPAVFAYSAVSYTRLGRYHQVPWRAHLGAITSRTGRLLVALAAPVGAAWWVADRRRLREVEAVPVPA